MFQRFGARSHASIWGTSGCLGEVLQHLVSEIAQWSGFVWHLINKDLTSFDMSFGS